MERGSLGQVQQAQLALAVTEQNVRGQLGEDGQAGDLSVLKKSQEVCP